MQTNLQVLVDVMQFEETGFRSHFQLGFLEIYIDKHDNMLYLKEVDGPDLARYTLEELQQ